MTHFPRAVRPRGAGGVTIVRVLPLLLAVLPGACARAPGARAPAPAGDSKVVGYLASWGVRREGVRIADLPAEQLTHINYAFAAVTPDGLAALGDPCLDAGECVPGETPGSSGPGGNFAELRRLKARHPHLRLLVSFGGWTGSGHFSDAAATPASREAFAASAVALFLRRWPGLFDGVDVDWEFPVSGGLPGNRYRPEDRENFTLLLAELRRRLDREAAATGHEPYLLTVATSAVAYRAGNVELDRVAEIVDWINVMTYDYHAGSRDANFNSPLFAAAGDPTPDLNVHASVEGYEAAGVPPRKIVIGIPFYGRALGAVPAAGGGLFQQGDPEAAGEWGTALDYRTLKARRPEEHGFRRVWHDDARVPSLYNPELGVWITYDDPRSVGEKAHYARERGLGGVMFWELSEDDGSLLDAVRAALR
jgi:chitinase